MKTFSRCAPPLSARARERQKGAIALVVGLILFFGASLITIYTTSPVLTEQRVAANEYRSFQALNAAEAGLAHAQDYFRNFGPIDSLCNNTQDDYRVVYLNGIDCIDFSVNDNVAAYGQARIQIEVEGWSDDESASRTLSQSVYVRNLGDGPNLDDFTSDSAGGLAPINFSGNVNFEAPKSDVFEVIGAPGGSSIALQNPASRDAVVNAITEADRADNYKGAITGDGFGGSPWNSANALNDFITTIEQTMPESILEGNYSSGRGPGQTLSGVNVVTGNATFSGNDSGSGVLVVKGDLTWNGTPEFDGLIIVLGGSYTLSGGGKGGLEGSIFISNLINNPDGTHEFGDTNFSSDGGGNATFSYNREKLEDARSELSDAAKELWSLDDELENEATPPSILERIDSDFYRQGLQSGVIPGSWVDFQ